MPQTPEDLDDHKLITFGQEVGDQRELLPASISSLMPAQTPKSAPPGAAGEQYYGIYRAVLSGLGMGALPNYFDEGSANLVRVLPELQSPATEAYFVYPEELRQSARTRYSAIS